MEHFQEQTKQGTRASKKVPTWNFKENWLHCQKCQLKPGQYKVFFIPQGWWNLQTSGRAQAKRLRGSALSQTTTLLNLGKVRSVAPVSNLHFLKFDTDIHNAYTICLTTLTRKKESEFLCFHKLGVCIVDKGLKLSST